MNEKKLNSHKILAFYTLNNEGVSENIPFKSSIALTFFLSGFHSFADLQDQALGTKIRIHRDVDQHEKLLGISGFNCLGRLSSSKITKILDFSFLICDAKPINTVTYFAFLTQ